MFHKGLWYQNYKQTKMIVWILLVLFIIHLPFQAMFAIETWRDRKLQFQQQPLNMSFELHAYDVLSIFSRELFPFFIMLGVVILACLLIGVERNTRRMDFTFSLPFSRKDIFLAKWLYGVILIIVFHTVNFMIAYLIIKQSEFAYTLSMVSMNEILFGPLLGFLIMFSFALFMGTIAGEMISQIVLTFIFSVFPMAFALLTSAFLDIHYISSFRLPEGVQKISVVYYVFAPFNDFENLIYAMIGIILFTGLGIFLYERNLIEHNGELFIYKILNPIFLVVLTITFSLFGGIIVSSLAPWNADTLRIIAYWIGFFIFLFFSYLILRRLLRMNLMVKNK